MAPAATEAPARALPSPTIRVAGLLLAAFTAILAVTLARDTLAGGHAAAEAVLRMAATVALVALALALAALSLAPAVVRGWIERRSSSRNRT